MACFEVGSWVSSRGRLLPNFGPLDDRSLFCFLQRNYNVEKSAYVEYFFLIYSYQLNQCNYLFYHRHLTVVKRYIKWELLMPISYISKKSRLLKFCCVPATSVCPSVGIFVAATSSTNQTNKAGSMCH